MNGSGERLGEAVCSRRGVRPSVRTATVPLGTLVLASVLLGACSTALSETTVEEFEEPLLSGQDASQLVEVVDVRATGEVVSGRLVNRSTRTVRNVRIVVRNVWLWNDERHPGRDNPGRADFYTLADDVPSLGSVEFEYRLEPPLPQRSDGRFNTVVEVVSFLEIGS
jgi:hypothetical protein